MAGITGIQPNNDSVGLFKCKYRQCRRDGHGPPGFGMLRGFICILGFFIVASETPIHTPSFYCISFIDCMDFIEDSNRSRRYGIS